MKSFRVKVVFGSDGQKDSGFCLSICLKCVFEPGVRLSDTKNLSEEATIQIDGRI